MISSREVNMMLLFGSEQFYRIDRFMGIKLFITPSLL